MEKLGRNETCHCGSGKKYKKCCLAKDEQDSFEMVKEQRELSNIDYFEEGEPDYEMDLLDKEFDEKYYSGEEFEKEYDDEEEYNDEDEEAYGDLDNEIIDEDEEENPEYSKKISDESPIINEEQEQLVDIWWNKLRDIEDPVLEKKHLEQFMSDHPELVINLGLQHEVLFELVADYLKIDKYDEIIEFLIEIRKKFPDTYLKSAGYYDRDIIIWLIANGRQNEIPSYLNILEDYVIDFADLYFEVKDLLLATNNIEILTASLNKTHHRIINSDELINKFSISDALIMQIFEKYTDLESEVFSPKVFIDELKDKIDYKIYNEVGAKFYWQKYYDNINKPYTPWPQTVPKKKSQLIELHKSVSLNFIRFIKEKTGIHWAAAEYFSDRIFDYLSSLMENNRMPKRLFDFTPSVLDKKLGHICKDYFSINFTKYASILNAIYYFADYLLECGNIDEVERDEIKSNTSKLYHDTYPGMKKFHAESLIFTKFPYL